MMPMEFGVYRGAVVQIREKSNSTVSILLEDESPASVNKDELILLMDGVLGDLAQQLHEAKNEINALMRRMYRLDEEYHKKIEALREMYMNARSKEIRTINQILRNSQGTCQK